MVELREVCDDLERSYPGGARLLAAPPGLRGIYNIGAGNRGIAQGARGIPVRELVSLGHELTVHTRRFLL